MKTVLSLVLGWSMYAASMELPTLPKQFRASIEANIVSGNVGAAVKIYMVSCYLSCFR